jgi:hypothetical protein
MPLPRRTQIKPGKGFSKPRKGMRARAYRSVQTRAGLIQQLDIVTSLIVRRRDGSCITCGTTQDLTCSHFYKRGWYGVRWDLRNCAAQCERCNERHNRNPWPYLNWLLETYPEGTLQELHALRMSRRKIPDYKLRELLDSHRAYLRTLARAA